MPYLISRVRKAGQINIKNKLGKNVVTLDDETPSIERAGITDIIKSLTTLKDAGFVSVEEVESGAESGSDDEEAKKLEAERLEEERIAAEGNSGSEDGKGETGGDDDTKKADSDTEDGAEDAITLPLEVRPEDPEVAKATIIFAMKQVIAEGKELTNDDKPQMDALRTALGFNEVSAAERDEFMQFVTDQSAE